MPHALTAQVVTRHMPPSIARPTARVHSPQQSLGRGGRGVDTARPPPLFIVGHPAHRTNEPVFKWRFGHWACVCCSPPRAGPRPCCSSLSGALRGLRG